MTAKKTYSLGFSAIGGSPSKDFTRHSEGYVYLKDFTDAQKCAGLGFTVNLPNGAKIESISAYYYNYTMAQIELIVLLSRRAYNSPESEEMARVHAVSGGGPSQDIVEVSHKKPIDAPVVDNTRYTYFIIVRWCQREEGDKSRFYGCKIRYSL